ncbi:MAG: hypothetical protein QOE91_830 [Gaiellaceae bacterium]|nr:hypothetical protein [Gaiellaceae bacterium]
MQYMLLIYTDPSAMASASQDDRQAMTAEYMKFTEDLRGSGAMVAGDELKPATTAKTVTVQNGDRLITDGPFAETKETLGGYYLVEADSEEKALEWAAKIPGARHGKIEVREVVQH